MREYLKKHISPFKQEFPFRIIPLDDVRPYINSIPVLNLKVAAGNFTGFDVLGDYIWIEPPFNISAKKGYFICKVTGESMNNKIPNGSYCLFKPDEGGSRDGQIVIVESTKIKDTEFGFGYGYTVKQYHSHKNVSEDEWGHESITLKPMSNEEGYSDIILKNDETETFKVIGIFEKVLG